MDNYYFAYMHTNILKIPMVTVSVINGVSIPILDEKRLGKPPPTKWWSSPSDHAIAPQWGAMAPIGGRVHHHGGVDVHWPLPSRFRRFYGTY